MHIRQISAEDTWLLRHQVMWPGQSIDFVKLPEDQQGIHYGLFAEDKLISVISLFMQDNKIQFRKFATSIEKQGFGYGTKLLKYIIEEAHNMKAQSIWCNARDEKCSFYERFGMLRTQNQFNKAGIDYVIMEKILTS